MRKRRNSDPSWSFLEILKWPKICSTNLFWLRCKYQEYEQWMNIRYYCIANVIKIERLHEIFFIFVATMFHMALHLSFRTFIIHAHVCWHLRRKNLHNIFELYYYCVIQYYITCYECVRNHCYVFILQESWMNKNISSSLWLIMF